ncbi:MAG: hypothetical protein IKS07_10535 [Lachnospiraceae bacterium]|nr:hypothetical protein [Lachnospiraceae bacterium]
MDLMEFCELAETTVRERFGDGYEISRSEMLQNNGVIRRGISARKKGGKMAPNLYLEPFYRKLERGVPESVILDTVCEILKRCEPEEEPDLDFYLDFEKVRSGICLRLIGREQNEELLRQVPFLPFLDLAIVFFYLLPDTGGEMNASVLIRNSHLEIWEIGTSELMQAASEAAPKCLPASLRPMAEIFAERLGLPLETVEREFPGGTWFHVLTNKNCYYGASAILYPGVVSKLSETVGGNLYIIPSSVNELLILRADPEVSPEYLGEMIREVNRTEVPAEEVLSDHLYFFDSAEHKFAICS